MIKFFDKKKKTSELRRAIVMYANLAELQANNQNKRPFLDKATQLQSELSKLENDSRYS